MFLKMFDYIQSNGLEIIIQIRDHISISVISILVAAIVGVPLGYFASKSDKSEKIISTPFNVLRVVPSLAILALLIPIMGVGIKPAVVSLTILAIPPVIINTIVGFREVPDFMVECAAGIGMDEKNILWKVRVPMAKPMILAGIRIGLIEAVASATLASKIGAGGVGEIIFTGLGLNRMDLLFLGGVIVAILSLASGILFDLLSKALVKG